MRISDCRSEILLLNEPSWTTQRHWYLVLGRPIPVSLGVFSNINRKSAISKQESSMPIETEKKYRLTNEQRSAIEQRLRALGASPHPIEFEENTLYQGGRIDFSGCALRLRRVNGRAILTFKQRLPGESPIKHQLENECEVGDADRMDA